MMKFILIFYLTFIYAVYAISNSTIDFLQPKKIFINGKYYNLAKLNERCVINEAKYTPPIERGISEHNCENGLTCFNFTCKLPSKENDSCNSGLFWPTFTGTKEINIDLSDCTSDFYCSIIDSKCKRTKKLGSPCSSPLECINPFYPNSTCHNGVCVQTELIRTNTTERYILVFLLVAILLYIYYRQYKIQEMQLIRLNELVTQNQYNRRRDFETETLPPYSPPSSSFLAENEGDANSQCSQSIRPPSYHQYPTYNPPLTSVTGNNNNNDNSIINIDIPHSNSNIYPDPNSNRLSYRNSRLSVISAQSSNAPSTPPPSYSQPTTPYMYNMTLEGNNNDEVVVTPSSSTSRPPLPPNNNNNSSSHHLNTSHLFSRLSHRRSSLRHSITITPINHNNAE